MKTIAGGTIVKEDFFIKHRNDTEYLVDEKDPVWEPQIGRYRT